MPGSRCQQGGSSFRATAAPLSFSTDGSDWKMRSAWSHSWQICRQSQQLEQSVGQPASKVKNRATVHAKRGGKNPGHTAPPKSPATHLVVVEGELAVRGGRPVAGVEELAQHRLVDALQRIQSGTGSQLYLAHIQMPVRSALKRGPMVQLLRPLLCNLPATSRPASRPRRHAPAPIAGARTAASCCGQMWPRMWLLYSRGS